MRKKLSIVLILLFTLSFFVNCDRKKYNENKLYYFNFRDSLTLNVTKTATHGKAIVLNDSVVLYKNSTLIYENQSPNQLFEKTKKEDFLYDSIYSPKVSEVDPPYELIKTEKSNIFQVIKNTDTLFFYFESFEKVDFMFYTF